MDELVGTAAKGWPRSGEHRHLVGQRLQAQVLLRNPRPHLWSELPLPHTHFHLLPEQSLQLPPHPTQTPAEAWAPCRRLLPAFLPSLRASPHHTLTLQGTALLLPSRGSAPTRATWASCEHQTRTNLSMSLPTHRPQLPCFTKCQPGLAPSSSSVRTLRLSPSPCAPRIPPRSVPPTCPTSTAGYPGISGLQAAVRAPALILLAVQFRRRGSHAITTQKPVRLEEQEVGVPPQL